MRAESRRVETNGYVRVRSMHLYLMRGLDMMEKGRGRGVERRGMDEVVGIYRAQR